MEIWVNGESREVAEGKTLRELVADLDMEPAGVAVEVNREVVPRGALGERLLADGDRVEVVRAIGGGAPVPESETVEPAMAGNADPVVIGGQEFHSRLLVGTGKYADLEQTAAAVAASGAEIVTVAMRRANLGQRPEEPNLLDYLDPREYTILPNTAGCFTAEDAVRTCRLARELGGWDLVKLEVLGDEHTLYPDLWETARAAETLIEEGFRVMVYTMDDPVACRRFEELGCAAVMPLAAPIGSGLGIQNKYNLRIILEQATVPILVDAGVGTASDVAVAMELGCDGVLLNTAIAEAGDPVRMGHAMRHGIQAGRSAYLAGRMAKRLYGSASSPLDGTFF